MKTLGRWHGALVCIVQTNWVLDCLQDQIVCIIIKLNSIKKVEINIIALIFKFFHLILDAFE